MNEGQKSFAELGAEAFQEGRYSQAENFMHAALREVDDAGDELEIANILDNLAEIYFEQGKYDKAEPLYDRSLTIRERTLPSLHEDIVASLNNLSALYFFQERYVEAEPLCKRLNNVYMYALGAEHPEVANSLANLGLVYAGQKQYEEAEKAYKRS